MRGDLRLQRQRRELVTYGVVQVAALSTAWIGQAPEALHLGVLAGVPVLAIAAAARFFRWQ
ncbi:hypothetical protein [Haloechinothrix alba]|uniref:hypothetical protein n=1 Tax=Haloechinothrix alba TaxID=664784 RepID=UPI001FE28590|nr:hypothetical protein [Haloechinothrix alba]